MTYVIAEPCVDTKDNSCVEVCPVDCIHPTPDEPDYESVTQLYIDPDECIDCDACVEACPVDACFAEDQLPEEWAKFTAINAEYFQASSLPYARRARVGTLSRNGSPAGRHGARAGLGADVARRAACRRRGADRQAPGSGRQKRVRTDAGGCQKVDLLHLVGASRRGLLPPRPRRHPRLRRRHRPTRPTTTTTRPWSSAGLPPVSGTQHRLDPHLPGRPRQRGRRLPGQRRGPVHDQGVHRQLLRRRSATFRSATQTPFQDKCETQVVGSVTKRTGRRSRESGSRSAAPAPRGRAKPASTSRR